MPWSGSCTSSPIKRGIGLLSSPSLGGGGGRISCEWRLLSRLHLSPHHRCPLLEVSSWKMETESSQSSVPWQRGSVCVCKYSLMGGVTAVGSKDVDSSWRSLGWANGHKGWTRITKCASISWWELRRKVQASDCEASAERAADLTGLLWSPGPCQSSRACNGLEFSHEGTVRLFLIPGWLTQGFTAAFWF